MSNRKLIRAVQNLISQIQKVARVLTKRLMNQLLRLAFTISRRSRSSMAGFILPTTVLLLLVVSLTVGAIVFRAYNRSTQVIGESQQRVIYNAATPAVDRARAKIENLFDPNRDYRFPGGVPDQNILTGMLLNQSTKPYGVDPLPASDASNPDVYTLPGETRINLDGKANPTANDNAWAFRTDTDGDGTPDATVVYSIILQAPPDTTNPTVPGSELLVKSDRDKADSLWVRQAPLSNQLRGNCSSSQSGAAGSGAGWFQDLSQSSLLRKNFQVDALVVPDKKTASAGTFTTLELQHDRQVDRGNKWGAWFRYDLEILPGSPFNWNGAMHTEGSLMIDKSTSSTGESNGSFDAYLVSAKESCLMTIPENSEITFAKNPINNPAFKGLVLNGSIEQNSYGSNSEGDSKVNAHVWPAKETEPSKIVALTPGNDSATGAGTPSEVALDPIALLADGVSKARGDDTSNATTFDNAVWRGGLPTDGPSTRIKDQTEPQPYVDDLYRADDRYGPKPRYNDSNIVTNQYGTLITADGGLTTNNAPSNTTNYGLDGYWERRARDQGLRLIIGQRLELGNASGWVSPNPAATPDPILGDPLNPPTTTLTHEARQRRTLRDNLAAVQATAVYHNAAASKDFPVAFVATTAHPGTAAAIKASTTFKPDPTLKGVTLAAPSTSALKVDFFGSTAVDLDGDQNPDTTLSQGTNGWEFEVVPGTGETEANFITQLGTFSAAAPPTTALGKALSNLAHFAGDPKGAFPPTPDTSTKIVHPFPEMSMWGNFSNLRQTLGRLESGTTYANLSIADKSNLHTAAGTLGMLAYSIQNYNDTLKAIADQSGGAGLGGLGTQLFQLVDGQATNGNGEVGKAAVGKYGTKGLCDYEGKTIAQGDDTDEDDCPAFVNSNSVVYDPDYYASIPGTQYVKAFQSNPGLGNNATGKEMIRRVQLLLSGFQIDRDRTFGFLQTSRDLNGDGTIDGFPIVAKVPGEKDAAGSDDFTFKLGCTPQEVKTISDLLDKNPDNPGKGGKTNLSNSEKETAGKQKTGLLLAFCSASNQPKYPALHYLFPKVNHGLVSSTLDVNNTPANTADDVTVNQPLNEPYVGDPADLDGDGTKNEANPYITGTTVNNGFTYRVLNTGPDDFTGVLLNPKTVSRTAGCSDTNWCLPTAASTASNQNLVTVDTSFDKPGSPASIAVPFLDRVLFDGREMMPARVLNVDLSMLRSNNVGTEPWLPNSGIVYAFREDAVREDAIARPASGDYTNATDPASPKDPPLKSNSKSVNVSIKQVDFLPDPDRRPYGFRLQNGAIINRSTTDRGMTFVSDNPVYIQGDFNKHQNASGTELEEFTVNPLPTDEIYDKEQFYKRSGRSTSFARSGDQWRPTEVLADSVAILSNNFCDGSIEDTFTAAGSTTVTGYSTKYPTCASGNGSLTSFLNQNRPTTSATWARENPGDATSPIAIDRNGKPITLKADGTKDTYSGGYTTFSTKPRALMTASNTIVNSIIVGGIVPSRANQYYGGLQNFPRMLEDWKDKGLRFAGAFLQLNFSNYATGPFAQNAWEPGTDPTTAGHKGNFYYQAPKRLWGYDPGLQLAPSGPAAARFVTGSKTRNEFYKELPVDDAYINNLCKAVKANAGSNGIPTDISSINCPA